MILRTFPPLDSPDYFYYNGSNSAALDSLEEVEEGLDEGEVERRVGIARAHGHGREGHVLDGVRRRLDDRRHRVLGPVAQRALEHEQEVVIPHDSPL